MRCCLWYFPLLVVGATSPAFAQSVHGRVLLPDSTPVVGAAVIALDHTGATVARALSRGDGSYSVQLPGPGSYELRILRIGFSPSRASTPSLAAGDLRSMNFVLSATPMALPTVNVTDRDCGARRHDQSDLSRIWDQARAALAAPHASESGPDLSIHLFQVQGTEDGSVVLGNGRRFTDPRNRHLEMDSINGRETYTSRLFATTPAETLAAGGYVRRRPNGSVVFDAPSVDALLSDDFASRHCFDAERTTRHGEPWLGIAFKPIRDIDTLADIEGVLWLDSATAQLRELEFGYTNVHYLPVERCVSPGKQCVLPSGITGDGTGGTLAFTYLPSGEWLLNRWVIRTPAEESRLSASGVKRRAVGGRIEDCERGPGCETLNIPVPRLSVNTGAILDLMLGDVTLYRDGEGAAALGAIFARQARKAPASLAGEIRAQDGRPLRGVVIAAKKPARSAVTDSAGRFEIHDLPAENIDFSVRKTGFQGVAFRLPLAAKSTRRIQLTLLPAPSTRSPQ